MNESSLEVLITRLPESEGLELPSYQTDGSAGMDVRAAEDRVLQPGETALIPTGFSIAVPVGYEAQMRPRSGLALKHGITLMNSPGTIDSDYRGPVGVILSNLGHEPFFIHRGDRIAQMVIAQVKRACWKEVGTLDDTARGAGGFGSSGRS
jgi:dUTP pyrophosphatase